MSTVRQILANRANAEKSPGPRSETGRRISSANAIRHGLCYKAGRFFLLADEDPAEFQQLSKTLLAQYQPQTSAEEALVLKLIHHRWLRGRALRLQNGSAMHAAKINSKEPFTLGRRYQKMHELSIRRCLNAWQELLKERKDLRRAA